MHCVEAAKPHHDPPPPRSDAAPIPPFALKNKSPTIRNALTPAGDGDTGPVSASPPLAPSPNEEGDYVAPDNTWPKASEQNPPAWAGDSSAAQMRTPSPGRLRAETSGAERH
ncbi:hypothetical protein AAFF_G00397830 [Aldrovandia affinis]|uniref:Uncharacterized protein n=1 Tax=Aldrovandia affinis TaxID=143900 RepID=A0AAD7SD82_9TELE|nr:hypothetical protein AAFF_G00397830 [Aldrovandia affinis]